MNGKIVGIAVLAVIALAAVVGVFMFRPLSETVTSNPSSPALCPARTGGPGDKVPQITSAVFTSTSVTVNYDCSLANTGYYLKDRSGYTVSQGTFSGNQLIVVGTFKLGDSFSVSLTTYATISTITWS